MYQEENKIYTNIKLIQTKCFLILNYFKIYFILNALFYILIYKNYFRVGGSDAVIDPQG
jgi:hypothetical protein